MRFKVLSWIFMAISMPFLIDFMCVLLWGKTLIGQDYTIVRQIIATAICGWSIMFTLGVYFGDNK